MSRFSARAAFLVTIAAALVFGISSVTLASEWKDVPDSLLASYGVTDVQLLEISNGWDNGLWKPFAMVTRAQFTKMAWSASVTAASKLVNPTVPTFTDVPSDNYYYPWIDSANAAGLVNGIAPGVFGPNGSLTREQAVAIIVRSVAEDSGSYPTALPLDQVNALLSGFADGKEVSPDLRIEMAYAIDSGIVKGNNGNIDPQAHLTRIQAAALLVRASEPARGFRAAGFCDASKAPFGHVTFDVVLQTDGTVSGKVDSQSGTNYFKGNVKYAALYPTKDAIVLVGQVHETNGKWAYYWLTVIDSSSGALVVDIVTTTVGESTIEFYHKDPPILIDENLSGVTNADIQVGDIKVQ